MPQIVNTVDNPVAHNYLFFSDLNFQWLQWLTINDQPNYYGRFTTWLSLTTIGERHEFRCEATERWSSLSPRSFSDNLCQHHTTYSNYGLLAIHKILWYQMSAAGWFVRHNTLSDRLHASIGSLGIWLRIRKGVRVLGVEKRNIIIKNLSLTSWVQDLTDAIYGTKQRKKKTTVRSPTLTSIGPVRATST